MVLCRWIPGGMLVVSVCVGFVRLGCAAPVVSADRPIHGTVPTRLGDFTLQEIRHRTPFETPMVFGEVDAPKPDGQWQVRYGGSTPFRSSRAFVNTNELIVTVFAFRSTGGASAYFNAVKKRGGRPVSLLDGADTAVVVSRVLRPRGPVLRNLWRVQLWVVQQHNTSLFVSRRIVSTVGIPVDPPKVREETIEVHHSFVRHVTERWLPSKRWPDEFVRGGPKIARDGGSS